MLDEKEAIKVLIEEYEIVRDIYHGFGYLSAFDGTPQDRLRVLAGAIEWILERQQQWAAKEEDKQEKESPSPVSKCRSRLVISLCPRVNLR